MMGVERTENFVVQNVICLLFFFGPFPQKTNQTKTRKLRNNEALLCSHCAEAPVSPPGGHIASKETM